MSKVIAKGEIDTLVEKWDGLFDDVEIRGGNVRFKKFVTATLIENSIKENQLSESAIESLNEAPVNGTSGVQNFDPVLINLIRRSAPNMLAYDLCGVQPMSGPTGLIFALRAHAGSTQPDPSADQAAWAAASKAPNEIWPVDVNKGISGNTLETNSPGYADYKVRGGITTTGAEDLGNGVTFGEATITIEKIQATAKTRALRTSYSVEMAQDLKAIHGIDAEAELANVLATEVLVEINREVIETIRRVAKLSVGEKQYAADGTVLRDTASAAILSAAGLFDMESNTDGRWQAEKYKALLFKISKEANSIAKETRRGRGNVVLASSDVVSALDLAGKLDYAPGADNNFNADDTGQTFVGLLQGRYRVYVDPYLSYDEIIVGYRGVNSMIGDAGLFYCPYVPLQKHKAVGENDFQPRMAFKSRYAIVENPFTTLNTHGNSFYRKFRVTNL